MPFSPAQRLAIVQTHLHKAQREASTWNRHRRWFQSRYWQKTEEGPQGSALTDESSPETLLETNYPYAFIDTMIANVCPLNPQVTVHAKREEGRDAAKVRETLANETLRREKTHDKLWKIATSASLYPRGIMKVVWDRATNRPKYRLIDPRRFFFDQSAECWEEIRYAVEVLTLTWEEFEGRCKERHPGGRLYPGTKAINAAKADAYPRWLLDDTEHRSFISDEALDVFKWVTVYEFYDFTGDGKLVHMLDTLAEPLLEDDLPYNAIRNPFTLLTFNDNQEDLGGMSDVQLIEGLQEQLNEIDTLELAYYKANIPVAILDESALEMPDDFETQWANSSQPGSYIKLQRRQNVPGSLNDVVKFSPTPSVLLGFSQKREQVVRQIEFLLGIPQYSRGVVGVADVATEVALSDAATRTRNGRRQKKIYDVVKWMGECAVALYHEHLDDDASVRARPSPSKAPMLITRKVAGMPAWPKDADGALSRPPPPAPDWEFEAVPYSAVENNRTVQLRNIRDAWPMLLAGVQAGAIDAKMLFEKLTDALMIGDIMTEGPAQIPGDPTAQGQQAPQPSADTIASGALPPGTEPPVMPLPAGGPGSGAASPVPVARGTSAFPES